MNHLRWKIAMNGEYVRIWKEAAWPIWKAYPAVCRDENLS